MKNVFAILLLVVLASGIYSCRKKGEVNLEAQKQMQLEAELLKDTTQIEFLDSVRFQFDTINEGDKVEHTFRIKNLGPNNFIIARAQGSCGCTVPEYPKTPVKPGDVANIRVTFNSEDKEGVQLKSVTVVCNTNKKTEMLFLTGFVKTKK